MGYQPPSAESSKTIGQGTGSFSSGHGDLVLAIAIADLNGAIVHVIATDHGDQRHADQLGILELAPGETFLRSS